MGLPSPCGGLVREGLVALSCPLTLLEDGLTVLAPSTVLFSYLHRITAGFSLFARRGEPQPVYNLHHLGNQNIGDRECMPLSYFARMANTHLRIVDMSLTDPLVSSLENQLVVLGGGGLLNPWCWHEAIQPLLERKNKVIGWGIGHHHDNVPAHLYSKVPTTDWRTSLERYRQDYPLEKLWLCGVRDYGQSFEYVPCSTCMSPLFDRAYRVPHEVLVYQHGALEPIQIADCPTMSNVGDSTSEQVIAFLASGRYVITNSYHGAYWGVLLGRKVVVYEPWCSKFRMLRFALPTCTREDWSEKLGQSTSYPGALAECRRLNVRFAKKVFLALDREARLRKSRG